MKNEIVRARCIDMSVEGQGIAKANDLVIFVKGMIPDEEADVKIIAEKKNYAFGIVDKLIKESPYRIKSECPVAYKCGGCDYRHIDYNYQLKLKKNVLVNTLKNYKVEDIIPDDNPYYYRNKVQIPVKDHQMGFYRKFSNDVVVFDDCLIESKLANEIIEDLKVILVEKRIDKYFRHILIKHAQGTGEIMLGFIVNNFSIDLDETVNYLVDRHPNIKSIILNLNDEDTNVILGKQEKLLYGRDYIYDIYDNIKVKLSLKSFYQVNYEQMLKLYSKVKQLADVGDNDDVLDLYCGIGTISLYMARFARRVTGIEIVEAAIDNARDNAKLNDINNVDFILADASKNMDEYIKDKDLVILDPPRKGISNNLVESLIKNITKKIVYVSCNPATLNRDLDLLSNYYNISNIYPIDMFPWTHHVETVVLMSRIEGK